MAKIYNSDLFKELKEGGKLQTGIDKIPTEIADKVVPVMEVNPKLLRRTDYVKDLTINNQTSGTIHTTSSVKDTFLTFAQLGFIKDVTSTATSLAIATTINGVSAQIIKIPCLTLTVQDGQVSITPIYPIRIDRNVTIRLISDTNVANVRVAGCIGYYEIENINA